MPTPRATSSCWGDGMRERRYLTFDMENPRHREALSLFSAQSSRLRSEYVVDCILEARLENRLEETVRRVITEALKDVSFSTPVTADTTAELRMTETLSELPNSLLSSLEEI